MTTDNNGVLAESGAIIDYIIAKCGNGRLMPKPDHPGFPDYLFSYDFGNGSMMSAMPMSLAANLLSEGSSNRHPIIDALLQRVHHAFELAEKRLGHVNYFAGNEFTSADIMMLFLLTTMRVFVPFDLSSYPNIRAYLKRIGERAAYRQVMRKGDPDFTPLLE